MVQVPDVLAGDVRGVARALSVVEQGGPEAEGLMRTLRGRLGSAQTVGITGAPGVGKSTLVQALGIALVGAGTRVAVLAVDPSSPFSGGALLGDRVRMPDLLERGAFVRSMATRGALGGLAVATSDALDVLDAAGFDWILVETVGVGQDEVDIAGEVHTVVLVTVGGLGDEVQAAKAGVMEIANIFAVNKTDQVSADGQVAAIESALALAPPAAWQPPVVRTSALTGEGIEGLRASLLDHRRFLDDGGRRSEAHRRRARRRVERLVSAMIQERIRGPLAAAFDEVLEDVGRGELDPYAAARRLLETVHREAR
ncbi:MAG: methylmalonyl Co-A mutase-associated GTPase MeaB [Acidobacteriia bacterium]|nr:methylmalonyl Co-A mutase-associated GTPase MeaB [Terriglobia bacterium]